MKFLGNLLKKFTGKSVQTSIGGYVLIGSGIAALFTGNFLLGLPAITAGASMLRAADQKQVDLLTDDVAKLKGGE